VIRFLEEKGINICSHKPRLLTHSMLADVDLAVAMGLEHRDFVARIFGYQLPLFSEIAYQRIDPMPGGDEVVPNWQLNSGAASAYAKTVMNYIFNGMPGFMSRMEALLPSLSSSRRDPQMP
jgi:protein-tyrosine-phosphatase